uniref:hypothetical protein n=1 Tax=Vibrio alfacsensis TaxID=1074311 RepID=UPI001F49C70D|nr:hypothetical protein [Vibrio alfacsensis]
MRYAFTRLSFYVVAFIIAIAINFFLPRMMPGDPIQSFIGRLVQNGGTVNPETIAAIEALYGYSTSTPLYQQF